MAHHKLHLLARLDEEIEAVERAIAMHPDTRARLSAICDEMPRQGQEPFHPPPHSVAIPADVTKFDFAALGRETRRLTGRMFDVVLMDPPWRVTSQNPSRGVVLPFPTMADAEIARLPVRRVQDEGLLFLWVVNGRHEFGIQTLTAWGYRYVGSIAWLKRTSTGKLAKGHGYYLQHAKETCLVGVKGSAPGVSVPHCTVIDAPRRDQSHKPDALYDVIEASAPQGLYLELFGRRHNLRNGWVTVGNQL